MGSKFFTIPKGVIREKVLFYAMTVTVGNQKLFIGRNSYEKDIFNSGSIGRNYAYIKKLLPTKKTITLQEIIKQPQHVYPIDKFRKEFLSYFDTDFELKEENIEFHPSIRSMTTFMFQHQNLIASKFALLYRMESFEKRKSTIRDFEVFMHVKPLAAYNIEKQIENLEKEIKPLYKEFEIYQRRISTNTDYIKNSLKAFFALLGSKYRTKIIEISSMNLEALKQISLDTYIEEWNILSQNDLTNELHLLEIEIQQTKSELDEKNSVLNEINEYLKLHKINEENQKKAASNLKVESFNDQCPICSNVLHTDHAIHTQTAKAYEKIFNAKRFEQKIEVSYFEEQTSLTKEVEDLNKRLDNYKKSYNTLYQTNENQKKYIDSRYELQRLATEVQERKNFLDQLSEDLLQTINGLEEKLNNKKIELDKFDIKGRLEKLIYALNQNMTDYLEKMEFEDALGNPDLRLHIDNDIRITQYNNEHIHLYEMGSGANWLSMHISFMMGLHKYIAKHSETKIPSFLFLDQPSQVYFPSEELLDKKLNTKDTDIENVKNIYQNIIHEVSLLKNPPQIIITDHYTSEEKTFDDNWREDWRENQKKKGEYKSLVPVEWPDL